MEHLGETIPGHYRNYCDLNRPNIWVSDRFFIADAKAFSIDSYIGTAYTVSPKASKRSAHRYQLCLYQVLDHMVW